MLLIKELMTLRAKEPIKALQKPQRSLKPLTNKAANPKITALITKANKPKVIKVIGKERKLKTGCNKALSTPNTTAEINAFPILSISTPVGSLEIMNKATVVTNKEIIIGRGFIIENSPKGYYLNLL
jgi:hypothetical protein